MSTLPNFLRRSALAKAAVSGEGLPGPAALRIERDPFLLRPLPGEDLQFYRKTINKHPDGMIAVCEQTEWNEMDLARPGYHTLIRGGFTNECEAEKLARVQSGSATTTVRLKGR